MLYYHRMAIDGSIVKFCGSNKWKETHIRCEKRAHSGQWGSHLEQNAKSSLGKRLPVHCAIAWRGSDVNKAKLFRLVGRSTYFIPSETSSLLFQYLILMHQS